MSPRSSGKCVCFFMEIIKCWNHVFGVIFLYLMLFRLDIYSWLMTQSELDWILLPFSGNGLFWLWAYEIWYGCWTAALVLFCLALCLRCLTHSIFFFLVGKSNWFSIERSDFFRHLGHSSNEVILLGDFIIWWATRHN